MQQRLACLTSPRCTLLRCNNGRADRDTSAMQQATTPHSMPIAVGRGSSRRSSNSRRQAACGRRQVARHLRGAGNFSTPCNTRHSRLASILQFGYKNSNWSNEDRQNLQLATCLANLLQVTVTRLRLSHQQHKHSLPTIPSQVASSFSRAPVRRIMIVRESHRTAIGRLVWNVNAIAAISANLCCTLIMVATN